MKTGANLSCLLSLFIDVQPQSRISALPHKVEESAEDLRRIRRQRSRPNLEPSSPPPLLGAIKEEDKSKSSNEQSPPAAPSWPLRSPDKPINKIEIDSDNIETPPVTRRVFSPPAEKEPCRRLQSAISSSKPADDIGLSLKHIDDLQNLEVLGDGQFDRFSATRRTRRYKRPTDYNSQSEDSSSKHDDSPPIQVQPAVAETQVLRPSKLDLKSSYIVEQVAPQAVEVVKPEDKDTRLRKWQDRLKRQDSSSPVKEERPLFPTEAPGSVRWGGRIRHQTSINQEDVQKAIRELKSPTDSPRNFSASRSLPRTSKPGGSSRNSSDVQSGKMVKNRSEHELNDEGFEETNSLNSESNSQGASSGCNEPDIPAVRKVSRVGPPHPPVAGKTRAQSVTVARPLRPVAAGSKTVDRRALSLKKVDSQSSVGSLRSRGSLRSSRSSLNSSASVATVRRVAPPAPRIPPPAPRVAASRSSSSGSSVAQRVPLRPPPAPVAPTGVPPSRSSSSGSSSVPPRRPSSFMRPTEASRTKRAPSHRTQTPVK